MSFNLYFIPLLFSIGLSECRHCQTCITTGSKAICPFSKSKCFLLYGPSMPDNLDITLRGCNDMNREPVIYFNGKRVPIVDATFYNPIGVICEFTTAYAHQSSTRSSSPQQRTTRAAGNGIETTSSRLMSTFTTEFTTVTAYTHQSSTRSSPHQQRTTGAAGDRIETTSSSLMSTITTEFTTAYTHQRSTRSSSPQQRTTGAVGDRIETPSSSLMSTITTGLAIFGAILTLVVIAIVGVYVYRKRHMTQAVNQPPMIPLQNIYTPPSTVASPSSISRSSSCPTLTPQSPSPDAQPPQPVSARTRSKVAVSLKF